MAAKKSRSSQKTAKPARRRSVGRTSKKPSDQARALSFVRTRIVQYEADLALLLALLAMLEGTGGRASVSSKVVKTARAAGWLQDTGELK